ncbi:MAG: T9SS type A sorting domain-containing protein [Bacteroidota bacterium]
MKKVFLLLTLMVVSGLMFGQSRQSEIDPNYRLTLEETAPISTPRLEFDTILPAGLGLPCGNPPVLYNVNPANGGWGFVAGNNSFGDKAKVQKFDFTGSSSFNLQEIWGFFAVASANGDADITAKVYSADGAGAPDQELGSSNPLKTSQVVLDTVIRATIFTFASPIVMTESSFFAGFDINALYAANDTVALVSTNGDNQSCGVDAWEQWSDDTWHPFSDDGGWDLDVDQYIGVMVEFFTTDIEDPKAVLNGLTLRPAYPNPAADQVSINYEIADARNVEVVVYGIDGKEVRRIRKGIQTPGAHQELIDVQSLPAGTYAYGVFTDGARLLNRFVIAR